MISCFKITFIVIVIFITHLSFGQRCNEIDPREKTVRLQEELKYATKARHYKKLAVDAIYQNQNLDGIYYLKSARNEFEKICPDILSQIETEYFEVLQEIAVFSYESDDISTCNQIIDLFEYAIHKGVNKPSFVQLYRSLNGSCKDYGNLIYGFSNKEAYKHYIQFNKYLNKGIEEHSVQNLSSAYTYFKKAYSELNYIPKIDQKIMADLPDFFFVLSTLALKEGESIQNINFYISEGLKINPENSKLLDLKRKIK